MTIASDVVCIWAAIIKKKIYISKLIIHIKIIIN